MGRVAEGVTEELESSFDPCPNGLDDLKNHLKIFGAMFSQAQAAYLLALEKYLFDQGGRIENFTYAPSLPIDDRFRLGSDEGYFFLFRVWQSAKNHLKLTLHLQDRDSTVGLLRVDFNGRHKNPEEVNEFVPQSCRPFAGQWLETSHIHYYVQGYKPLVWAVPLDKDPFPIKDFRDLSQFISIFQAFGQRINLVSTIRVQLQPPLP